MSIVRRPRIFSLNLLVDYRSLITFLLLVSVSGASLVSDTRPTLISTSIRTAVSFSLTPIWFVLYNVQAGADYLTDTISEYDASRKEADDLRIRLNKALSQLAQSAEITAQNKRLMRMVAFEETQPRLTLLPASITPATVMEAFDGKLRIDKGSFHGVATFMCAVTEDGVVGVVVEVQPMVSYVYTLQRSECKIGAVVRRNRVRGVIHGGGFLDSDYICSLQYIDLKDDVRPGDEIITSGVGGVFPSGYPIGRIVSVNQDTAGSLLQSAVVAPVADPHRLDEVFIVLKAETMVEELSGVEVTELETASHREILEPSATSRRTTSVSPSMPDLRTLQQRFAP